MIVKHYQNCACHYTFIAKMYVTFERHSQKAQQYEPESLNDIEVTMAKRYRYRKV